MKLHLLLLSLPTLLLPLLPPAVRSTNTFIYAACSPSHYPPSSPFQSNLTSLLASISTTSSSFPFRTFSSGPLFGLYQCRHDLSLSDCSSCVRTAIAQLPPACPAADAAALQLDGCLVRYGGGDFAGGLETAVEYRRCGGEGGGGEMLRRRDGVLDEVGGGAGGFRVRVLGEVEGYGECEGDLNAGDCAACLGKAVEEIRRECGKAIAADLFLQKCYVRVWADGYYPGAAAATAGSRMVRI